jgi:hypothetical protein
MAIIPGRVDSRPRPLYANRDSAVDRLPTPTLQTKVCWLKPLQMIGGWATVASKSKRPVNRPAQAART